MNGVTRSGEEPFEDLVAEVRRGRGERWAAIAALALSSDSRAYDALMAFAAADDWTVRRAAVEALGQRSDGWRAEALLRVRLQDESPYVVRTACEAVGALGLVTLHTEVLSLLDAQEPATRHAALRGVEALWAPEHAEAVLRVHDGDPDPDVQREAAYVLRRRSAPELWPSLVARWRDDAIPRHRVWACELAAASGVATLREDVATLVDDQDGHVRAAARAATGRVSRPAT